MNFLEDLLTRCSTATKNTTTSFVMHFPTISAAATFAATTKCNAFKSVMVDPVNPLVVYINFATEQDCTKFGAALAPHMGPAFTVGKGKFAPVFDARMLPPTPVPSAGLGPVVSVFVYARPGSGDLPGMRFVEELQGGVTVLVGEVQVSAITINDCENGEGFFNVTIGTSMCSLSTKRCHLPSTTYAIDCWEQWQSAVQADKQALENWVNDSKAMRDHFLLHGKYLTTLPNLGYTRHCGPGQTQVLYRFPTSAPASTQVVALRVEPTDVPTGPVSEMDLLMQEMEELDAGNTAIKALIAYDMGAKKAAEEAIATKKALDAMRSRRDALVAEQSRLKAAQEALRAATQALRSA